MPVPIPPLPASGAYRLANAKLHASLTPGAAGTPDADGFLLCDLSVDNGVILAIESREGPLPSDTIDLAGRIVLPSFVDCHTHIDKGHITPRTPNPDGTFGGALQAAEEDRRARWNAADLRRRMDFSLRCAFTHGTAYLRTHLDSSAPQEAISWPVFEEMRETWQGRIALQAVSLVPVDAARDERWFASLVRRVVDAKGVLGGVTFMVPDLDALLDRVFRAASDNGLDLDFHADETDDTSAVSLDRIAEAALRHRFQGKILVGHCCSLARQPDDTAKATLDKVARAGVAVVSLPLCNLYLQDRRGGGTTPRWRGVTLLHEMKARGIPVAIASDNTRDPFYAYGDLDAAEVFRAGTRILHLDHPFGDWIKTVTATPAEILRLEPAGMMRVGGPADFTIFQGRSWSEFLSRPESNRIVVRAGRAIGAELPDYAELDDLMG